MNPSFKERIVRGNFGATQTVTGGEWRQIAQLSLSVSSTITVATAFQPFPTKGAGGAPQPTGSIPKVNIRIRLGAGGAKSEIRTLAGNAKSCSGTDFYIEAQVFYDENGQIPAPNSLATTTQVVAYFSDGEGQDLQPTTWLQSLFGTPDDVSYVGPLLTIHLGPGRIREIIGYNHSVTPGWLMIFDWPIPNAAPNSVPVGVNPKHIIPLPGSQFGNDAFSGDPYFSEDYIESKSDFTYGITFAVSSTGDVFTYDDTGLVRVELELYRGEQFSGTTN